LELADRATPVVCFLYLVLMYVPSLHYDAKEETYVGGLFWDGRSPSLKHQAGEPFLCVLLSWIGIHLWWNVRYWFNLCSYNRCSSCLSV